jgi:eukaryotic-like serine/threonine-protein kinase
VESGYAILHDEPEPLPPEVPPVVAQLVLHCLEKEPARRLQSASDLAFALGVLRSPTGSTGPVLRASRVLPRRAVGFFGAAAVLAALLVFVVGHLPTPAAPLPDVEQVTFRWGTVGGARFLPDGRVAFSAAFENQPEEIFVRPPGSPETHALGLREVRLVGASGSGELGVILRGQFSMYQTRQGTLARVPSVGGTPRELVDNTEYADWSPAGDLATVRVSGGSRTLESPPGKVLFRTTGWISHPRFSRKGDRLAFLHHPVSGSAMGEVVVADLQGQTRTLTRRWPNSMGLAWSPDDSEVWFTNGESKRNVLSAVSLEGTTREIYQSLLELRLEDVGRDGQVLLVNQMERVELVYTGDGGRTQTLLSWTDWNQVASLSSDGKMLFSVVQALPTKGLQPSLAMLRSTDGAPPQLLGEGQALDLSPDGRWALVRSDDHTKLTALPTGAGQPKRIETHGLDVSAARWMPDGKRLLVSGWTPPDSERRLYLVADDGSKPARVSDAALSTRRFLEVSPDSHWAAAADPNMRLVIVSMSDGTPLPVPSTLADARPRGWSPEGHLWVTQGGDRAAAQARLLRFDIRSGKVLEERSIGPTDPSGVTGMVYLVLTPDGRGVAFTHSRTVGYLYIARGLWRAPH